MDIGVGLPVAVPGAPGRSVIEFARAAETNGFASVGTLDRVVYDSYEPLCALAAAAAVTDRVRLTTSILISPLRTNTSLLAKQASTVHALSAGRLVLGLGVGGREDDYLAAGLTSRGRGRAMDTQLAELHRIWRGEGSGPGLIGPRLSDGDRPEVIIGGTSEAAMRRVAVHGDGWISGGGGPPMFQRGAATARAAWADARRAGRPRLLALGYFALGADADAVARATLGSYYAFLGPIADFIVAGAATSRDKLQGAVAAFEAAGCDELILSPCSADPGQVELLAEALG